KRIAVREPRQGLDKLQILAGKDRHGFPDSSIPRLIPMAGAMYFQCTLDIHQMNTPIIYRVCPADRKKIHNQWPKSRLGKRHQIWHAVCISSVAVEATKRSWPQSHPQLLKEETSHVRGHTQHET